MISALIMHGKNNYLKIYTHTYVCLQTVMAMMEISKEKIDHKDDEAIPNGKYLILSLGTGNDKNEQKYRQLMLISGVQFHG